MSETEYFYFINRVYGCFIYKKSYYDEKYNGYTYNPVHQEPLTAEQLRIIADKLDEANSFQKLEQICSKCGKSNYVNKSKYCGDGSDKDNAHRWVKKVFSKSN
jgi:ribosomal protein L37E